MTQQEIVSELKQLIYDHLEVDGAIRGLVQEISACDNQINVILKDGLSYRITISWPVERSLPSLNSDKNAT